MKKILVILDLIMLITGCVALFVTLPWQSVIGILGVTWAISSLEIHSK